MARRGKGTGRKAYLKHWPRRYDPKGPVAYQLRRPKGMSLAGLKHDPETGELVPVDYWNTQTHGKRGLTQARAEGPTAVAKHVTTADVEFQGHKGYTKSTMIPRAVAVIRMLEAQADEALTLWQKVRGHTVDRAHRMVYIKRDDLLLELWFEAKEFVFYRLDYAKRQEKWSRTYPSFKRAHFAFEHSQIFWVETKTLPKLPPPS